MARFGAEFGLGGVEPCGFARWGWTARVILVNMTGERGASWSGGAGNDNLTQFSLP